MLMSVPLQSKVDEKPKLLKRKNDKVRQILDQDVEVKEEGIEAPDVEMQPQEDETIELDPINQHP